MTGYDRAQICLNGHVINEKATGRPERNAKFCSKCGAGSISLCKGCRTAIRGAYGSEASTLPMVAPGFCHACGRPYPWTQTALKTGRELASELMTLTEGEKTLLVKSLHDIMTDTPATPLAAMRVKRLLVKAGKEAGGALTKLVTSVATEMAKHILFERG